MYKIIRCLLFIVTFGGAQGAQYHDGGGIQENKTNLSFSSHASFKKLPHESFKQLRENIWIGSFNSSDICCRVTHYGSSVKENNYVIMLRYSSPVNNDDFLHGLVEQLTLMDPSRLGIDILLDEMFVVLINTRKTRQFAKDWNNINMKGRMINLARSSPLDQNIEEEKHERTFNMAIGEHLTSSSIRTKFIHDLLLKGQLPLRTEHPTLTTGDDCAKADSYQGSSQPPGGMMLPAPSSHDSDDGEAALDIITGTAKEQDAANGQTGVADESNGDKEEGTYTPVWKKGDGDEDED